MPRRGLPGPLEVAGGAEGCRALWDCVSNVVRELTDFKWVREQPFYGAAFQGASVCKSP